jgi:hypothetical protein
MHINLKKFSSSLLALFIAGCSSVEPNLPVTDKTKLTSEEITGLEQEYRFQTKDLTESYLLRKLNTWLTEPVKGDKLVKEILFISKKDPDLFRDLMLADQVLLGRINDIGAVQDRRAADNFFNSFLESCEITSGSAPTGEFLVNTYTNGNQRIPAVAMDSDGDFVVAWSDYSGRDGSGSGVSARKYNKTGLPVGSDFVVNAHNTGSQVYPKVAIDGGGDFVITWTDYSGYDGDKSGIFARKYNSAGLPDGSEFLVNTKTASFQARSSVAMDSAGDFVIAWQSNEYVYEGGLSEIYARRYNSAGSPLGSEFQVNIFMTGYQANPSVAMDNAGDFVVAWQSGISNGAGQDGSNYGVYARKYNSAGAPVTSEFIVNSYTTGYQQDSQVAVNSAGDFVITWTSYGGQDGDSSGIFAQKFNSAGSAVGSEFQVNTYTTGQQFHSKIAMDSAGDFIISWISPYQDENINNLPYGYGFEVFARRYNFSGEPQGSEFRAHSLTFDWRNNTAVAMDSDGDFIIAWDAYYQEATNTYDIIVQRYDSNGVPK